MRVEGAVVARGSGRSKRQAERAAAHQALRLERTGRDLAPTPSKEPAEDEEDNHDP